MVLRTEYNIRSNSELGPSLAFAPFTEFEIARQLAQRGLGPTVTTVVAEGAATGFTRGEWVGAAAGATLGIGLVTWTWWKSKAKPAETHESNSTTLSLDQLRCLNNPHDISADCAAVRGAMSLIPFANSVLSNSNAARASANDQSSTIDPLDLPESPTTITTLRAHTPEEIALRKYVQFVEDLRRHFGLHIQRVQTLGLYLFLKHPEAFPGVTEKMVRDFLALHDRTKMDDSPTFRENFWGDLADRIPVFNRHSFLDVLFAELYAFLNAATPEAARKRCMLFIQALNEIDDRVGAAYIASLPVADDARNQIAASLKRLEHIADCVDRHYDPVVPEEMGRTQAEQDAKQFSEYLKNPEDVRLAEELAKAHPELTRGLGFNDRPAEATPTSPDRRP